MESEHITEQSANGETCKLCGLLPLTGNVEAEIHGENHIFCCAGCRMVYTMLIEAGGADPAAFKKSDLYRQCVAAGVVPASQADLETMAVLDDQTDSPDKPGMDSLSTLSHQCRVAGMWCPACAWVIQTALSRQPGVVWVDCDFSIDRLHYRYDPAVTAPHRLSKALGRLGYAALYDADATLAARHRRELLRLIVSAVLSMNAMMLSWALYSGFFTELSLSGIRFISWPIFIFATAVLLYGGGPVARKAWSGLLARSPGMEVLILLGAGSAYGLSLFYFFQGSIHLYFDTAAMLITLLLLGKWLENRAKEKVRRDLEGFMTLQPRKMRLCSAPYPHGRFVAADQVTPGDLVRVLPSEIVPVDGTVTLGRASVDLSAVTGEPEPVPRAPGDSVVSGSRIVSGQLDIRADQVGERSLLGQMIAVVQSGLSHRAEVENRSRRILTIFVPIIISAALMTALVLIAADTPVDQALVRAITVVVAACPCALGIAVPLARVAGISGAAKLGLLVRDSMVFNPSYRIDTIVFDKTGTLTEGKWRLVSVAPADGVQIETILGLALALENGAEHPAAVAIEAHAASLGISPAVVSSIHPVDGGLAGQYDGRTVAIGSPELLIDRYHRTIRKPAGDEPMGSQVVLTIGGKEAAVFFFNDPLRPSARDLVSRLDQMGYRLHLISGDTPAAVKEAAAAVGIKHYRGGLLPQDKAEYIKALQARNAGVAMVGDGINDAAALSKAQLAVAVHSGAPLTRQVGAVTLMRSDPAQLLDLLHWLRRVNRKIRQNLGWAWVYNILAVPMAMAGWLTPLIAVSAMLLSSLTLIVNTSLLVGRRQSVNLMPINQVGEKSQV